MMHFIRAYTWLNDAISDLTRSSTHQNRTFLNFWSSKFFLRRFRNTYKRLWSIYVVVWSCKIARIFGQASLPTSNLAGCYPSFTLLLSSSADAAMHVLKYPGHPTKPFKVFEPQNLSIDFCKPHKTPQSTEFEAEKKPVRHDVFKKCTSNSKVREEYSGELSRPTLSRF